MRASTTYKRELNQTYYEVLTDSQCEVSFQEDEKGPLALTISLSGPAAKFPSTSNDRKIHMQRRGIRIGHSAGCTARMAAARALFQRATHKDIRKISFGAAFVHVRVALAANLGMRDSHNYSKPICDWLEHIGVIENDSAAECFCYKRAWYGDDARETIIHVVRWDAIKCHLQDSNTHVFAMRE